MAIDKTLLNIYRGIAENNPRSSRKAEMICKGLKIPFKKEEFKSMKVFNRKDIFGNIIVNSFQINTKNCEIEIDILEDRYFVTRRFKNNGYQFINQYLYEENYLLEETFNLEGDNDSFATLDECYPRSSICVENNNKSVTRFHIEDSYIDFEKREIFGMKNFINEVQEETEYEHKEVVYFLDKQDMYYYIVKKSLNVGTFMAGVSLGSPTYNMGTEDMEGEEKRIFRNLGMIEDSIIVDPKIYMFGTYKENDINKYFEINILKLHDNIYFRIVENTKNKCILSINPLNIGNISIGELYIIKRVLIEKLQDKPYIDWITNYLDEAIERAEIRINNDLRNISSYNQDILDFLILEGKGIYYQEKGKNMSLRAYELYERKSLIPKWIDSVNIKPLELKKGEQKSLK